MLAVVISHEPDVVHGRWKTTVVSQWGSDGEYFHDYADVNQQRGRPTNSTVEKKRRPV